MIFVCGSVSSRSLIDAARPTVRGRIVPGKTTKLRNGRMESTSGIWGADVAAAPIAVASGGDFASVSFCKAISGSSFMIAVVARSTGARFAAQHALFQYPLTPVNALRARTAHNQSPWRVIARRVPQHAWALAHRGHLAERGGLTQP